MQRPIGGFRWLPEGQRGPNWPRPGSPWTGTLGPGAIGYGGYP